MEYIYMDLETFSEANLPKCGAHRYAEDPSTEVLLWGYAVGEEPAKVWDLTTSPEMPEDLRKALERVAKGRAKTVWHNGMNFDSTALRTVLKIDLRPRDVIDTMVLAYECGLPGSLADLSNIFRLDKDHAKDADGKRLVQKFCKPQPEGYKIRRCTKDTHPEDWARFVNYCRLDVEAERVLFKKLPKFNVNPEERALQCLDAEINNRGIKIDLDLVNAAIKYADKFKAKLDDKTQELTNGAVSSAAQTQAMLETIESMFGIKLANLQKAEVNRLIELDSLPEPMRELLRVRSLTAKSSVSKYKRMLQVVCADGRMRGLLQFRGASRTGRFSCRLAQFHNLPRPSMKAKEIEFAIDAAKSGVLDMFYPDNVPAVLADCLRGCITVEKGHKLVVADYSNIEGRVLAWAAGEAWKIKAFEEFDAGHGHDLYKLTYARSFNVKPESVTKAQRQMGKVLELAMGYGGGPGAFVTFAKGYGIDLNALAETVLPTVPQAVKDEAVSAYEWARTKPARLCGLSRDVWLACDSLKRLWRRANPNIVKLWYALGGACIRAINEKRAVKVPTPGKASIAVEGRGNWLLLHLPSKRKLCYASPRAIDAEAGTWSYYGVNQRTRKWQRLETYGGKVAENLCQSIAADVLTAALPRLELNGFKPVLTIHDEVLTECLDTPDFNAERMGRIMCKLPWWAEGLPLAAAGFEAYRYRKD